MGGRWQCLLLKWEGESEPQTKQEPEEAHELGIYWGVFLGNNTTTIKRDHNSHEPLSSRSPRGCREFPLMVSHNSPEPQGFRVLDLSTALENI